MIENYHPWLMAWLNGKKPVYPLYALCVEGLSFYDGHLKLFMAVGVSSPFTYPMQPFLLSLSLCFGPRLTSYSFTEPKHAAHSFRSTRTVIYRISRWSSSPVMDNAIYAASFTLLSTLSITTVLFHVCLAFVCLRI